jgi:hypothetical protein
VRIGIAAVLLAAACGSGGGFPDAPKIVTLDPGTVSLSWKVEDPNRNSIPCSQVNATTVFVDVRDANTNAAFSATFDCNIGAGTSGALPAATYNIKFALTNNNGMIASAPPQNAVVVNPGKTTLLMPIVFVVF